MKSHFLPRFPILALQLFPFLLASLASGAGSITFVDGTKLEAEILFQHPNAPLLVVRSAKNSSVQSFPISEVAQATIAGKVTNFSAPRALTADEKTARELNSPWADTVTPKQLGRYGAEKWEKKPLIVWAKPGESGDAMQAAAWLDETGKPLGAAPWKLDPAFKKNTAMAIEGEFNGDILLPAAEQPYDALQAGNRDKLGAFRVRHLTIEKNANYKIRYTVAGNLWLKDKGDMGANTQTGGLGSGSDNKHTVIRFCGERRPNKASGVRRGSTDGEWAELSHWIYFDSGDRGSVEIIGESGGAGDRLTLDKGTLVVSEDSYIGNGPRASFYTKPDTTTILLDGARIGCTHKVLQGKKATYGIAGTLQFGAPEHPLKRDLRFGAAFLEVEDLNPNPTIGQRSNGASFVLGPTGKMVTHSADPTKARVIFCPRPADASVSQYALTDGGPRIMPTGVSAAFLGKTEFNGVMFEGFYKSGILVNETQRKAWKNVSFGPSNQGKPDELFKAP